MQRTQSSSWLTSFQVSFCPYEGSRLLSQPLRAALGSEPVTDRSSSGNYRRSRWLIPGRSRFWRQWSVTERSPTLTPLLRW